MASDAMLAPPPMLTWACVEVGKKDASGLGEVRLAVTVLPGQSHNVITEVTSELIWVSVGVDKKSGRANLELLGFLHFLLGLEGDDQLGIERGESARSKIIVVSGVSHDKRSMIWLLQSKVGEKHAAHFAADVAAALRRECDPRALKRRKEETEFRQLQEEAQSASLLQMAPAAYACAVKPKLPPALKVKRAGVDVDVSGPRETTEGTAAPVTAVQASAEAAAAAAATPTGVTGAAPSAALVHYDSESEEDDDEDEDDE